MKLFTKRHGSIFHKLTVLFYLAKSQTLAIVKIYVYHFQQTLDN
jgi:hypothetical protein